MVTARVLLGLVGVAALALVVLIIGVFVNAYTSAGGGCGGG